MKYRLIIADDEYFIRQRLIKIIPESFPEIELAGEAENGEEVLALLEKSSADIILLDIKMPKLSGLEVSEYIQSHYPHVKIIILSGYNEFEFARKALQTGVYDYLLKPICRQTLLDTISCCLEKIRTEQQTRQKLMRYALEDKRQAIKDHFMKKDCPEDFLTLYPAFRQVRYSFYAGLYASVSSMRLLEILMESFRKSGCNFIYIQESDHTFLFQFFLQEQKDGDILRPRISQVFASTDAQIFYHIGDIFPFTEYRSSQYHTVKNALLLRFFPPVQPGEKASKTDNADPIKVRRDLAACLNVQNPNAVRSYISALFDHIVSTGDPQNLYTVITEILLTLQLYFSYSSNIQDLVQATLEEEYTLEGLRQTILNACFQAMEKPEYSPSEYYTSNKVADYIRQNYNRDLSVAAIADIFTLNPSYLSNMFKKIYKVSINQYITQIRMEHAVSLLKTHDYKIHEVAEMTGYADVFYFSKRFKKYIGQSPKDFQNSN